MTRPHQTSAYVALGANLGPRLSNLRAAALALAGTPGVHVIGRSTIYETAAVANTPQPAYLNAVVRTLTSLSPRALLDVCLEIERRMGRVRPPGRDKAPRTIDLDLLLHGPQVVDEPGLQLPHPGLLDRPFVLVPLADVAEAGLRHPVTGAVLDRVPTGPGSAEVRAIDQTWND